ncbi:MAG TPA: DUF1343 domain-containing protein [Bacteroidales bacterium]|nr:DUF1343 domain-containing protein [Bacteroidales bacterium]
MKYIFFTIIRFLTILAGQAQVKTGLQVLADRNFKDLENKRVGLITNLTGVDRQFRSIVDILYAEKKIKLVALFSPEHGVRGDYQAGEYVAFYTDRKTQLPVYSIYGKTRKATPEMLKGIDVLVYDIQDIGSRSYTYISTLGLAMEAAAENNIEFIVLDRPNPLGGEKIEGCLTEPAFTSFVSQFPIPYIHGLTVGELATYLNEEGLLTNKVKCNLKVIPMKGWKRSMRFEDTGLPWIPSSPHIPHAHTPYFYPATGILGELYVMNIGVGYTLPFQLIAAPWVDADSLTTNLNGLKIPGLVFSPVHYKPYYSTSKGEMTHGIQIHITDYEKAPLSLVQFYVLQECHKLWPAKNVFEMCDKSRLTMFDNVCGTDQIRLKFEQSFSVDSIIGIWNKDVDTFRSKSKKHFLY